MQIINNTAEFDEKVLNSDKLVLIDFYADWCGPCQMLTPLLEELSTEMDSSKVSFFKLDTDANQEIAMKYEIRSIPNVIIFKNGKPVATQVGLAQKELYRSLITEQLLKG